MNMRDMTVETLVTHSGTFHADEVFAHAILAKVYPSATLVRTRDESVIWSTHGIVFDVGQVCDAAVGRFDHHQADGPKRADNTPYSSVGLIWRAYGTLFLEKILLDASTEDLQDVWQVLDDSLIHPIDLLDNGLGENRTDGIGALIDDFNLHWDDGGSEDDAFWRASLAASEILTRRARRAAAAIRARSIVVEAIEGASDPAIIILPRHVPWEPTVFHASADILYVIYPRQDLWYCTAVPSAPGSFDKRKSLPAAWGGLRDEALHAASGIADAVFCHPALFICGAASREGAISMAKASAEA